MGSNIDLGAFAAMALVIPAALIAWAVTHLILKAAILDFPNVRSSHKRPTPRSGGLGIAAGFMTAMMIAACLPFIAIQNPWSPITILMLVSVMTGLGFVDDLYALGSKLKFTIMILAIGLFVVAVGPVTSLAFSANFALHLPFAVGMIGSALFIFVVINASNFMDGANGMLVAGLFPASVGLGILGLTQDVALAALIGFSLAGALAGFALLNWDPAKIFAGDVGSLFAGGVLAAGLLILAKQGGGNVWLAPLLVLPFIGDVLLTLLKRARAGRLSMEAHREHAYQMLLRAGISHARVAEAYASGSAACAVLAIAVATGPIWLKLLALGAAVLGFIEIYRRIHVYAYSQGVENSAY